MAEPGLRQPALQQPVKARRRLDPRGAEQPRRNALTISGVALVVTLLLAGITLIATAQERMQALDWM